MHFGVVPEQLYSQLQPTGDWRTRSLAICKLKEQVSALQSLGHETIEFLEFLGPLMRDVNYKTSSTCLEIVMEVIKRVPKKTVQSIMPRLLELLVHPLCDRKQGTQKRVSLIFAQLAEVLGVKLLVPHLKLLLESVSVEDPRICMVAIDLFTFLLLRYKDLDANIVAKAVIPFLEDSRTCVKFVATECIAVLAFVTSIEKVNLLLLGQNKETIEFLNQRFKNPIIPTINVDGTVSHIMTLRATSSKPIPFKKPKKNELRVHLDMLSSSKWEEKQKALDKISVLIEEHFVNEAAALVLEQVCCLRSAVSKSALHCLDCILRIKSQIDVQLCEPILSCLMKKMLEQKDFLNEEVKKTLDSFSKVQWPFSRYLQTLCLYATHKHVHVRATSSDLLRKLMEDLSDASIQRFTGSQVFHERFLPVLIQLLRDGNMQTRKQAKLITKQISRSKEFKVILTRLVSPTELNDILKAMD